MTDPTVYVDGTARTARALENTGAAFANGMNAAASCSPGIGINIAGGAVDGRPSQFTLEDQDEDVRVPQDSQQIGGLAYVDRDTVPWPSSGGIPGKGVQPILTGTNQTNAAKEADPDVDGLLVVTGDANLQTLSAGWVDTAV